MWNVCTWNLLIWAYCREQKSEEIRSKRKCLHQSSAFDVAMKFTAHEPLSHNIKTKRTEINCHLLLVFFHAIALHLESVWKQSENKWMQKNCRNLCWKYLLLSCFCPPEKYINENSCYSSYFFSRQLGFFYISTFKSSCIAINIKLWKIFLTFEKMSKRKNVFYCKETPNFYQASSCKLSFKENLLPHSVLI